MSKHEAFRVGDYWLTKRRDGKSPHIWQIATGTRSVVYRSTKCRDLEQAKAVLRAHEAASRSRTLQDVDHAELLPHLFNYIKEHGPDVLRLDTIESSFRAWIGFLMQDELGTGVRVGDLNKVVVTRFRRWRMGPHSWEIEWGDKVYRHQHSGVSGEAVQRNIEDMRAALGHAEAARRIATAPALPSVEKALRSKPRRHLFTVAQLGAMIAYADQEPGAQQWLWLMIGTAARPDAALAFDPALQWTGKVADLHPPERPQTDKRNPVVPVIEHLANVFEGWTMQPVASRKRWWRTMRAKLDLPVTHVPKTIRHTVATYLRSAGVPGEQISALLGHKDQGDTLETTSGVYAHADPLKMKAATKALTTLWEAVEREADKWRAVHLLTITKDNNKILVDRKAAKAQISA